MLQQSRNLRRQAFVSEVILETLKEKAQDGDTSSSLARTLAHTMSYDEYADAMGRLQAVGLVQALDGTLFITLKGYSVLEYPN